MNKFGMGLIKRTDCGGKGEGYKKIHVENIHKFHANIKCFSFN